MIIMCFFKECHLIYYGNVCNVIEVWYSINLRFGSMVGLRLVYGHFYFQAKLLKAQGME